MRDLNDKATSNSLTADEWNDMPSEIQEVIEQTGQTLSGADLKQLAKGLAQYVANGDFYTDSGVADAYVLGVLASKQAPVALTDGMRIRFLPSNVNTGASTVNVAGLGVTNIFRDGSAASAGDIPADKMVEAAYDLANTRFNIITVDAPVSVGSVSQASLNTSTVTLSGSLPTATNVSIVLGAYAFFPMLHAEDGTGALVAMLGDITDGADPDDGRFMFRHGSGSTGSYDVDYRRIDA